MVGSEHRQDWVVAEELAMRFADRREPPAEPAGDVEQRRGVLVAVRQVLGAHRRPVRRLPFEDVGLDRGRHAPPDDRLLDAGQPEDLRHLGDVTEHVREIADPHRAPQFVTAAQAGLEVAEDRLAGDEELVHQHLPRADREPALLDEATDPRLGLGPNLKVVVERRHLPVEREPVALVGFHQVEQAVDEPDELQPEALEGEVPLPVPVGMRNEVNGRQAGGTLCDRLCVGFGVPSRLIVLCVAAAALACSAAAAEPEPASRSLGAPWAGQLVGGVQLAPEGKHFFTWDHVRKRSPNRGWRRYGNERLVRMLLAVLREYRAAHPNAPRVGVADLSRPRGGDFGPRFGGIGHASHQNGLDVDVYYPRRDRRELPPRVPRQIDRRLAPDLVTRFVAAGVAKVFVGPHTGLRGPPAVVEELPAYHDNHMHVRIPGDGIRSELAGTSTRGQPIRAFRLGSGRPLILVVGSVHGDEPAGTVVATRLLHVRPPARGSIRVVEDLNPDGHAAKQRKDANGVDLNRNFPPAAASERETRLAMHLILRLRPDVTIWFHQPQAVVRAWGPSVGVASRFARLAGMRFRKLPWPPGSATAWQHTALPGSRAFVVELPRGELGIREAGRYARAVLRLLDGTG